MAAATMAAATKRVPHLMIPKSITYVIHPLNANVASVHSDLRHLALTTSMVVYSTLSATPFITPGNPGPTHLLSHAIKWQLKSMKP
jgi:hypothetical protein